MRTDAVVHCNLLALPEKAVNFGSVVVDPTAGEGDDDDGADPDALPVIEGPPTVGVNVDSPLLLATVLSEGIPPKKSVPRGRLMGTGERGDDCEGAADCCGLGLTDGCIGRMGREGEAEPVLALAAVEEEREGSDDAEDGGISVELPPKVLARLLNRLAGPEKAEKEEERDGGPPVPVGTAIDDNVELVVAEVESTDPVKSKELA